jgi:pimeloyl-ACP methyl ester carboxylesterase
VIASERLNAGDHWSDWLASTCPALLIRGRDGIVPAELAREMADKRPGTRLVELDGDHFVHLGAEFAPVVREFLAAV